MKLNMRIVNWPVYRGHVSDTSGLWPWLCVAEPCSSHACMELSESLYESQADSTRPILFLAAVTSSETTAVSSCSCFTCSLTWTQSAAKEQRQSVSRSVNWPDHLMRKVSMRSKIKVICSFTVMETTFLNQSINQRSQTEGIMQLQDTYKGQICLNISQNPASAYEGLHPTEKAAPECLPAPVEDETTK